MCYLVRERQAGAAEHNGATIPPSLERLHPRWIGAVAAVLIGGVAVAALVAPAPTSPALNTKAAPAAPLASTSVLVPAAAIVEQTSGPIDDGVPSTSNMAKAGMGHCEHGL
jgi:hypothetical protein